MLIIIKCLSLSLFLQISCVHATLLNRVLLKDMGNLIHLKKFEGGKPQEVDCEHTMFMSPFHNPVPFSPDNNIHDRINPVCRWIFVGTEPCIPSLSCSDFNLESRKNSKCSHEYLEVSDGYKGKEKFCGKKGPENVSASNDLRDLYVTFKTTKNSKKKGSQKFKCIVTCSRRGQGRPLLQNTEPKVTPKCHCGGKPKADRIVGGVSAFKGEFPWIVALVEAKTRQPFCGGAIINDRMVLSAAHCFVGRFANIDNVQFIVNGHVLDATPNLNKIPGVGPKTYSKSELEDVDKSNHSTRYTPDEIIVHNLYVMETNDFDVALLYVKKPFDFDKLQINPVCLPELASYLRTFSGKEVTVAGWGLASEDAKYTSTTLQKLDVHVYAPKLCKNLYAHRVNRRMLCAGHEEGAKDSCTGDSGGPLVLEDRVKVWYQIGIVSWGEGCAQAGNPGVYFRTTGNELSTLSLIFPYRLYSNQTSGFITNRIDGAQNGVGFLELNQQLPLSMLHSIINSIRTYALKFPRCQNFDADSTSFELVKDLYSL